MRKLEAAACIKAAASFEFNGGRKGVYDSWYSGNRLCPAFTDFGGHSHWENQLVGRRQIGTVSKISKIIRALHGLES